MSAGRPDLQCRRVVELVTDYLEHALPSDDRNQLAQHLSSCRACEAFVAQHAAMIRALSALATAHAPVAPPPEARAEALEAFRRFREKRGP